MSCQYETITFPASRVATFDVGRIGRKKHHVAALLEIDVTAARAGIKAQIKAGRPIGFTAWFLQVVGRTVAGHTAVHAINWRGRRQVRFRDVDIALPIERLVDGVRVPLVTLIRGAQAKTIDAIAAEINKAKTQPVNSEKDFVLDRAAAPGGNWIFYRLPQWVRLIVWQILLGNPFVRKDTMGTVMVTSIGLSGKAPAWIIPKSLHNLCIGVGTIAKKPWVVGNAVVVRDIMQLTILFDHDVVDGLPAARFTDALVRNIQAAAGLGFNPADD